MGARVATVGFAAILWLAAITSVRALEAGFGGDGRAGADASMALLVGAAIGGAGAGSAGRWRAARPGAPARGGARAAWLAAVFAAGAAWLAPRIESQLCRFAVGAGEEWRPDAAIFLLASLVLGAPAAVLARWLARRETPGLAPLAAGGAIALVVLDSPWVPRPVAELVGWVSPLLLVAVSRALPERAQESAAPATLGARLAAFSLGTFVAGAVCAIAAFRVALRSLVRGTAWDLSEGDVTILLLASLGAALLPALFARAGGAAAAAGASLAAALVLLASRRLALLAADPILFHDLVAAGGRWVGSAAAVDGALYPAALVVATAPALFLVAGGGAARRRGSAPAGSRGAGASAGLSGCAVGIFVAIVACEGKSDAEGASPALRCAAVTSFALFMASALLGAVAAAAPGAPRRALALAVSLVFAAGAFGVRAALAPEGFQPRNLFSTQKRLVPEFHEVLSRRESLEGIVGMVEEPDWRGLAKLERSRKVRVDRIARTPTIDDEATVAAALDQALAARGGVRRALVLGVLSPRLLGRLRAAGVEQIDFAPMPYTAAAVAGAFVGDGPAAAGRDGLRFPSGLAGYDLVFWPPQPSYPANVASRLRAGHLGALEGALAEGGVVAVYLDLATTPPDVVDELRDRWLGGRGRCAVTAAASGLQPPALGLLVKRGSAPFDPRVCVLDRGAAGTFGDRLADGLPPIATPRSLEDLGRGDRFSPPFRAAVAAGAAALEGWARGAASTEVSCQRALEHHASAIREFFGAPWVFNLFVPVGDQHPISDSTLAAILTLARASGSPSGPAPAAYLRASDLLARQREFGRLLTFAKGYLDSIPKDWRAAVDIALCHRELLDPETGLGILHSYGKPADEEGQVAVAIEMARCQLADKHSDQALETLRQAFTDHPTSAAVAEALARTHLSLGDPASALPYANHFDTLTLGSPEARALMDKVQRASKPPSSRPSIGR